MSTTELNITEDQRDIFNKLYKKNKYTHDEINGLCEQLFRLNSSIDIKDVTINTPFAHLDLNIYDQNFKDFIQSCNEIFDDSKISPESKFIKINSSFNNNCYNKNFKNKFKLYLLQLRYICCFNHLILNKKLRDVILKNIRLLGNCDADIIDSYTPDTLRQAASAVYNSVPQLPFSQNTRELFTKGKRRVKSELYEFYLNLQNTGVQGFRLFDPTSLRDIQLPDVNVEAVPTANPTATPTAAPSATPTAVPSAVPAGPDINGNAEPLDQQQRLNLLRLKTRNNFNTLSNLYQNGFVSSYDVTNSVDHATNIDTAIDLNNTKVSLKNSFNTELAYYKAKVAAGDHDVISNTLRSLGIGFAPLSLGFSIFATNIISYILDQIFKTDYIKSLSKNKENLDNFKKNLSKFALFLFKEGYKINLGTIEDCTLQEGKYNNLFYTASKIQEDFFTQTNDNYDKFLLEYNNFIYVYNLICDKTKEEIEKFITCDDCADSNAPLAVNADSDAPLAVNADSNAPLAVNADSDAPLAVSADSNAPLAVNADDDYETKINKLYTVLENTGCQTNIPSQQFYNTKSKDEKKAILRNAFPESKEVIVPKCYFDKIITFFKKYIESVLINMYPESSEQLYPESRAKTTRSRNVGGPKSTGGRKTRKLRKNKTKRRKAYRKRHTRRH
jgi:hypothetical protein